METLEIGPLRTRVLRSEAPCERVLVLMHGFGAPGDDLAGLASMIDAPPGTTFAFPEAPHTLACPLVGISGQLAERVHATVYIGMQERLVMGDRIDDCARTLHRGTVVQIGERATVDLLVEDGKLRTQLRQVIPMGAMQSHHAHAGTAS